MHDQILIEVGRSYFFCLEDRWWRVIVATCSLRGLLSCGGKGKAGFCCGTCSLGLVSDQKKLEMVWCLGPLVDEI